MPAVVLVRQGAASPDQPDASPAAAFAQDHEARKLRSFAPPTHVWPRGLFCAPLLQATLTPLAAEASFPE